MSRAETLSKRYYLTRAITSREPPAQENTTLQIMASLANTTDDKLIKMLLVGNTSGSDGNFKQQLLETLGSIDGPSSKSGYVSTIGVDFKVATLVLPQGQTCKVQLWDTAGQERFRDITLTYFRGAHAITLCYDVHDKESFESLRTWAAYLKENLGNLERTICWALVGLTAGDKEETVTVKDEAAFIAEYEGSLINAFATRIDQGDKDAVRTLFTSLCAKVVEAAELVSMANTTADESSEKKKKSDCTMM